MKNNNGVIKIWRIFYPIGIHYGLLNLVTYIGIVFLVWRFGPFEGEELQQIYIKNASLFTSLGGLAAIPFLSWFFVQDKKFRGGGEQASAPVFSWLLICLITLFAGVGLNNLVTLTGFSQLFSSYEKVTETLYGGSFLVEVLGLSVIVPIAEELVFRGLIYNRLKDYTERRAAVILCALGFALYHGNIVQGVYAFLLSLLFIWLYEQTGSLAAPVAGHIMVNLSSVLIQELTIGDWMYKNYLNLSMSTGVLIGCAIGFSFWLKRIINRKLIDKT